MREVSGYYDANNREMRAGDILRNPLVNDLWLVMKSTYTGHFYLGLIPNSGMISHRELNLEIGQFAHTIDIDEQQTFEIIGDRYDNPELLGDFIVFQYG